MNSPAQLTIVLPCLNPGPALRDALQSVWGQQPGAPELVVIDGGSSDGSREWLESQRPRIDTLVSEPDRGIYNAMNKGVAHARGRWVMFLGADDQLASDTAVSDAVDWAERHDARIATGEAVYADGRVYRLASTPRPIARNFAHHQATLYERSLFREQGGFDAALAIAADYDFNLRLWKAGVTFTPIPVRLANCGTRGASDGGAWRVYREEIAVRHRHFAAPRCWTWDAVSVLRFVRKKLVVATHRHD